MRWAVGKMKEEARKQDTGNKMGGLWQLENKRTLVDGSWACRIGLT